MSDNDNNELLNENTEETSTEETVEVVEETTEKTVEEDFSEVFEELEEEEKKGGLFSRIKKTREERREAVGEDDDYDIFDLQDLMDIRLDEEELFEEIPAEEEIQEEEEPADYVEETTEYAAEDETVTEAETEKKPSFFSKLFKAKEETAEEPVETVEAEEAETEPEENEPEEAETEEEPEEVEVYVSPLREVESFEKETSSVYDDMNKLLAEFGMSPLVTKPVEEAPEDTDTIQATIDEAVFDKEKTKHIILEKSKKATSAPAEIGLDEDGQLILDGFSEDEPEIVDDEIVEKDLKAKRKSIIESFHVFSGSKSEAEDHTILETETDGTSDITEDIEVESGESVFEAVERTSKKNKSFFGAVRERENKRLEEEHVLTVSEIKAQTAKDLKRLGITTKILLGLTVVLGVLSVLPTFITENGSAIDSFFEGGARIYTLINIVLYAGCVGISFNKFKKAVSNTLLGNFDSKTVFLVVNVVVTLQMLIALAAGVNAMNHFAVYGFVGAMTILADALTEKKNCSSLSQSIATLTKSELRGIQPIEKKEDSAALGYDLSPDGDPSIYYSTDAKIPENIAELTKETSFESSMVSRTVIIAAAVGLVVDIIICIIQKSAYPLYSVLPCVMCLMLPVFRPFVLSLFKYKANKGTIINGVAVLSYDECDEVAHANAVVLDSEELLNVNVSAFRKFGKSKIAKSDAVVYTAAVLKGSGSLLSGCFDGFIEDSGITLPEITEFKYEEGLGFFACVGGARVIVGNRKCMELHSIDCPTEKQEKEYCPEDIVLYTSIQEQIVSTFIVRYTARRNIKKQIDAMNKTGIVIILRSEEPSLTDEMVADILGCSIAMIKLASSRGNEIVTETRKNLDIYKDNGILCSKKKNYLLYAIAAGSTLSSERKHSKVAQLALSILWVILFSVLGVFKVTITFSPAAIVIFEIIAAAISYFIGKIGNK